MILIIDDDKISLLLLAEFLGSDGYEVIMAKSGAEATKAFALHGDAIAMVITDIVLPDCNGWELAQRIRDQKKEMPIIAISAIEPTQLEDSIRNSAISYFISKPFVLEKLRGLVEKYL